MLVSFTLNFFFTWLLEGLSFSVAVRKDYYRNVLLIGYMNLLTNPLVTFLFISTDISLALIEMGVVIVETVFIKMIVLTSITWRTAFVIALCLNVISFFVGLIYFFLFSNL